MGRFARDFEPIYSRIRDDIFELCRELRFVPTPQQAEALRLVQMETQLPLERRKKPKPE